MIVYRKAFHGLHLVFRLYGSAIVRTALWGLLAAVQTALLYVLVPGHFTVYFEEGRVTVFTVLSTMLALLVIFRQNAGYGRFREGRIRLQAMSAAWTDACIKALHFDGGSKQFVKPDAASTRFRLDLVHLFSLLHGMAVQFLRSDWSLDNLVEHDSTKLPPWDSSNLAGYGPKLLDYLVLRSNSSKRQPYFAVHRVPVVGRLRWEEQMLLSMQGERIPTMSEEEWSEALKKQLKPGVIKIARHHFFANSQGKYVRGAAERVYQVYYWAQERCRQRMVEGGFDMPAPILAAFWQAMGRGLEAFEECRYLCDTPFPFSWAQLLVVMLLCFQFTLPFAIVASIRDWALGIILAIVVSQAYWSLNEVSRELEDPYSFEPNDIPLPRLQYQFNERILAVANSQLPDPVPTRADEEFRAQLREAVRRSARGSMGAPDASINGELSAEPSMVLPEVTVVP